MKIDDRSHEIAKKIVTEIVKERAGNVDKKGLKDWYQFIISLLVESK